jgi:ribose-phosphate pyrophosphokinase
MNDNFTIFSGRANVALATSVAVELGARLGACSVERFPDCELSVRLDEPVRGREVFIIQPTSPPVNDHLVELLALADACGRAAAHRITAIVPYFGYARADERHGRREPITARVAADLLEAVGVTHVVTVDLHTPQIEGFFHAAVDSLTAVPTLCRALRDRLPPDLAVVSADVGRMRIATEYARCFGTPVVVASQAARERHRDRDCPHRRRRVAPGMPDRGRHDLDRRHGGRERHGAARGRRAA